MEVVCNRASYNVIDGLLSTLRRVTPATNVVVQELGASGPGSLDNLLFKLLPTIGVLTAVADDHLSAFRNRDAVMAEKFKIVQSLPADGIAVLNVDDPLVADMLGRVHCKVRTFGRSRQAEFRASNVSSIWPDRLQFDLEHRGSVYHVRTNLLGKHSLLCALAAIAVAEALGADLAAFIAQLAVIEGPPARMREYRLTDGPTLILDHYKAAQYMMEDVIAFVSEARASNRYLVVGQISDTWKKEGRLFRSLVRECRQLDINFITIGELRKQMLRREHYGFSEGIGVFESALDVFDFINSALSADDLVLIKSNTSSRLERIVLVEDTPVRCRALSCGRKQGCLRCPELRNVHPPEFRFDESGAA